MPKTTRMCQIASCKREAATLCYHCQQEVCHKHFTQHSAMIMTDVHLLADRVNIIADDITTFSIAQVCDSLFHQLQQWRDESINIIENIYIQKEIELNEKIDQVDTKLSLVKAEKQQKVSHIKKKITEMIDAGEATFDQVNHLRKSVDKMILNIDKLRTSAIRIEIKPANLDTCRIILMDQLPHTKSEDIWGSVSRNHINNDAVHSKRPTNRSHYFKNQSMVSMKDSREAPSTPISTSHMTPHSPYVPYLSLISVSPSASVSLPTPRSPALFPASILPPALRLPPTSILRPLPPLSPFPVLHPPPLLLSPLRIPSYPVQSQMSIPPSSIYRPSKSIYSQQSHSRHYPISHTNQHFVSSDYHVHH